jgi:peptidoglycan/xylan/chitin deacetylase (PgdA/CDA1 family)
MLVPQIKSGVEHVLAFAAARLGRGVGHTLILAYHNVVHDHEAGLGDASLHLPRSQFLRQIDLLQRRCEVVSLPEALRSSPRGRRLRVAITFDDAYVGAVTIGLPELAAQGLPVTLFVAAGLLGRRSFWWDDLAASGLLNAVRHEALKAQAGRDALVRSAWPTGAAAQPLPETFACATAEDVSRAARLPGVLLGSHSWSHPNLAQLDAADLEDELRRPLEWLAATGRAWIPCLAYPYGLANPSVERAARAAGYLSGLLASGGWLRYQTAQNLAVPRYTVPAGISLEGFAIRLAGFGLR